MQTHTQNLQIFRPDLSTRAELPFVMAFVPAGFPSPAEDHLEGRLDLNRHLIRHPAATFFVRVTGESMLGAGIHPGDLLVVDRALPAADGRVVVAAVNGELTVKRIRKSPQGLALVSENPDFEPILISDDTAFEVWGVVIHVVHSV